MINTLIAVTVLILIKTLVLWLISRILKWKGSQFVKALLVTGLSFYSIYLISLLIPVGLYQNQVISRLLWSLPVLIPLIMIKLFYRSTWVRTALPVIMFILIDHFVKGSLYRLIFSYLPFS